MQPTENRAVGFRAEAHVEPGSLLRNREQHVAHGQVQHGRERTADGREHSVEGLGQSGEATSGGIGTMRGCHTTQDRCADDTIRHQRCAGE